MSPELERHLDSIEGLCRQFHVAKLDLFGSAAIQTGSDPRDFDFLVEFHPLQSGGYWDAYFGLLEGLTELLGRPVDLVVASAIGNPYFRKRVEETKISLYAA